MENIKETVVRMFVGADQRRWEDVVQCFAPRVVLDYASMTGNPAVLITRDEIVKSWQGLLPGFKATHHQLGNFVVEGDECRAHVFCYGTAHHFLDAEEGSVWLVVGTYDFDLINENASWQITRMKFNFKFQDGNTKLAEKAIAVLNP